MGCVLEEGVVRSSIQNSKITEYYEKVVGETEFVRRYLSVVWRSHGINGEWC